MQVLRSTKGLALLGILPSDICNSGIGTVCFLLLSRLEDNVNGRGPPLTFLFTVVRVTPRGV